MIDQTLLEPIEVAEVRQLPELTGGQESPAGFADMLLTSLLAYDAGVIHAEHAPTETPDLPVLWRLSLREDGIAPEDIEIAASPSLESFSAVLARFGEHYLDGQNRNGYTYRLLHQRGRIHRCHIYLSNSPETGFWIRVYAAREILYC